MYDSQATKLAVVACLDPLNLHLLVSSRKNGHPPSRRASLLAFRDSLGIHFIDRGQLVERPPTTMVVCSSETGLAAARTLDGITHLTVFQGPPPKTRDVVDPAISEE